MGNLDEDPGSLVLAWRSPSNWVNWRIEDLSPSLSLILPFQINESFFFLTMYSLGKIGKLYEKHIEPLWSPCNFLWICAFSDHKQKTRLAGSEPVRTWESDAVDWGLVLVSLLLCWPQIVPFKLIVTKFFQKNFSKFLFCISSKMSTMQI